MEPKSLVWDPESLAIKKIGHPSCHIQINHSLYMTILYLAAPILHLTSLCPLTQFTSNAMILHRNLDFGHPKMSLAIPTHESDRFLITSFLVHMIIVTPAVKTSPHRAWLLLLLLHALSLLIRTRGQGLRARLLGTMELGLGLDNILLLDLDNYFMLIKYNDPNLEIWDTSLTP